MDDARASRGGVVAAVCLLVVIPMVMYVASYLLLTDRDEFPVEVSVGTPFYIRNVRYEWMIAVYQPLSWFESLVSDERVVLMIPNEEGWISYPPLP